MTSPHSENSDVQRYSRQILCAPIGEAGQRKLLSSRVLLVGCGALGCGIADTLVRAGVGFLRIVDRDLIELSNLQRQILFDEDDVRESLPKAEAARRKLARINSGVRVEAAVLHLDHENIHDLAEDVDLLIDGTDNFETRFLINDYAVRNRRPWVYGACVGTTGMSLTILPGQTPCLRCVFDEPPPAELNGTCDTAGVLGPVASMVASFQSIQAIKILTGHLDAVERRLLRFDAWTGRTTWVDVSGATANDCPCCKRAEFEYLRGKHAGRTVTLCGRNAIQVYPGRRVTINLDDLAKSLRSIGATVQHNPLLVKAAIEQYELTVFADGRAVVKGTDQPERARAVYARYVGA